MKTRYRINWRGKVILQVEETTHHCDPMTFDPYVSTHWRDAKLSDFELEKLK
jgi:hypothetical protein